jgi:hypothetical protein
MTRGELRDRILALPDRAGQPRRAGGARREPVCRDGGRARFAQLGHASLVVVAPTAHRATQGAQKPKDRAEDDQDATDHPKDRAVDYEREDDQDEADGDHDVSPIPRVFRPASTLSVAWQRFLRRARPRSKRHRRRARMRPNVSPASHRPRQISSCIDGAASPHGARGTSSRTETSGSVDVWARVTASGAGSAPTRFPRCAST